MDRRRFIRRRAASGSTIVVASSTSLHRKNADFKCFGVNDEVVIQQAIDAANAVVLDGDTKYTSDGGGRVVLLDGIFYIHKSIDIPSCLSLVGQGINSTLLYSHADLGTQGETVDKRMIRLQPDNPAYFAGIEKLTLNGKDIGGAANHGIYTDSTGGGTMSDINITEVMCIGFKGSGMHLYNIWGVKVNHCICEYNALQGIDYSGQQGYFHSNFLAYNANGMLAEAAGRDDVIFGNSFYKNELHGLLVKSQQLVVSGNSIYGNSRATTNTSNGLYVFAGADGIAITGNKFFGNTITPTRQEKYGLECAGDNVLATGNVFLGTYGTAAAAITAGSGNRIFGNLGFTMGRGTAQIASDGVSIVQPHGLNFTPSVGDVQVTPLTSLFSAAEFYVHSVGATNFTITVNTTPGTVVDFGWYVNQG